MGLPPSANVVCFGPFKLDLRAGEVLRDSRRIRLQEQPFQVLKMLLEHPAQVVSREQIRRKLWPNDTVVEFDHSINAAIKKLRLALGDSAEEPEYVETVARRGYRLMVPVEWVREQPAGAQAVTEGSGADPQTSPRANLIGKKVSHYRVLEILGGGGMGVVYKAEDIKLGRQVALKFLPEELANSPEALERFEREARAASTLNHPNICTVYEFGEHEGEPFLAMELLEGQTLRQRIGAGAGIAPPGASQAAFLPLDQMLNIAMQIADGLEAAHGKGIVHRDIKPANIFVTDRGEAKILDFGIATLQEPYVGPVLPPPTVATGLSHQMEAGRVKPALLDAPVAAAGGVHLTRTGVALGTASYMSPEQVRGEKLDARTDLFSFGLVLYEMATGQQAFKGETTLGVRDAILDRAPAPVRELNPEVPPKLEAIINRAVEKDREARYQHAADIRTDLKRLERDTISGRSVAQGFSPAHAASWRRIAVICGVIVVGLATAYLFRPALPPPRVLSSIQITSDGQPKGEMVTDGTRLYFDSAAVGVVTLYQVSTAGGPAAPIETPVENPNLLDISSDRSQLLVYSIIRGVGDNPLYAVPLLGGPPHRLNGLSVVEAAWSPEGRLLFYSQANGGLYVASADGSAQRKLAVVEGVPRAPRWSPDGKEIRFSLQKVLIAGSPASIWEISADGKGLHQILQGWNNPPDECCGAWTPDAKYFFFQSGKGGTKNIWAIREGGSAFYKVNHQPVQLTTGPAATGLPLPSLDGKKLFTLSSRARGKLVRYNARTGDFVSYLNGISATCVDFSRDRQWIAYVQHPELTLWRSKVDGSEKLRLTPPSMKALMPRWSPDGAQIAFIGITPDQRWHSYFVAADGTGTPQLIPSVPGEAGETDPGWSPDGKSLVFAGTPSHHSLKPSPNAIHIMDMHTRKVTTLPGSEGLCSTRWSPDGRYIGAITNDNRRMMVYDLSSNRWSVLVENLYSGFNQWSENSQAIYFLGSPKGKHTAIFRVRLSNHKLEQVTSLEHFRQASGLIGAWMGIAPDDAPMLLEDVGAQDIYALDLELP